jgi:hypothetical protein|tara:strand:+ start:709 stop:900 length:192 start_codon:yes stop_codon:yes gene_type:complete
MNNDQTKPSNKVRCYGCFYFYITYKKKRPYGCKKFGFISKIIPSSEVFNTTGTECAYRSDKNL